MNLAIQVVRLDGTFPQVGKQLQQPVGGVPLPLPRGEAATLTFTVVGQDANVADLTGLTVTFTVRQFKLDPAPTLQKACAISSPTTGVAVLTLAPSDTAGLAFGSYVWDLWATSASPARADQLVPASTFLVADEVL